MKRAEQRKLFMEFYGVTPELKRWAADKWRSGTMSLSDESLSYMQSELDLRAARAEQQKKIDQELEKENGAARTPTHDEQLAGKRPPSRRRRRRKPPADTPVAPLHREAASPSDGDGGPTDGAAGTPQRPADH